mgnify:CR=1 FL=1
MIFYFTGTGNSLYVAKQLDDERYSIPQAYSQKELHFTAERIGIVCPVYGHEMPGMVKEFLQKAVLETTYFYIVLTYGNRHGGAAELAESFCLGIGKKPDYINTVLMVDNFLPAFDMEEQKAIDKKVEEQLAEIKADIDNRTIRIQKASEEDKNIHNGYLARVNHAPETIWADYVITDKCIGCGICTRVCPAGCIHLENQHAVNTKEGCQACYACIQACPEMAIQFGDIPLKEPNPGARYRNPNITLTELVNANDCTNKG